MDENLAYALAGYEAYVNGYVYDHEYNPVDKLLDCLGKDYIYCLLSIDPFNTVQSAYHLEAVCGSREEATEKAVKIKLNTFVLPFTTRFYVVKETRGIPENKDESNVPSKNELWEETNYEKAYKWKKATPEKLYWEKQIYKCLPDHPLSRCGYKAYTDFITKLRNDVFKAKTAFNVGEWMCRYEYANGPVSVYSDDKLSFITTYELNEERLNGTGITIPNIPTDNVGLLLDAEAEHFLGLKDRGTVITNGAPVTRMKTRPSLLQNAKKKLDENIFSKLGRSQQSDNSNSPSPNTQNSGTSRRQKM